MTIYTELVKKTNTQWVYPSFEDIQIAEKEQVLHCKVEGEWNLNDPQNMKYVLRNSDQVIAVFNEQLNSSCGYKRYIYMFPRKCTEYSNIL